MKLFFAPGLAGTHANIVLENYCPCLLTSIPIRLDSLEKNGLEWVKDLGKKNLEDMLQLIQWNEDNVR